MRRLAIAVLGGFLAVGIHLQAVSPAVPKDISVLLVLEGRSLSEVDADVREAGGGPEARRAARERQAALLAELHDSVQAQVEAVGGRVLHHFTRLVNVMSVRAPREARDGLAALPSVIRIEDDRRYRAFLSKSVPFVHAPAVWSGAFPATGKGVRVGVIDSGIDYHHADFGGSGNPDDFRQDDPTAVEIGSFPTQKIAGGIDLVGDDYNANGDGTSSPVTGGSPVAMPDPDPLDPVGSGHGTHVAGIIAGYGVLTNGATYRGPYTTNLDYSRFLVAPGVAPEATLYAIKIFGRTGETGINRILQALEYASDPNGDNEFTDRLDVVNLSLGVPFGIDDGQDSDVVACNNLARLGCVVVAAAGNTPGTRFSMASPAIAPGVLAVASSVDDGTVSQALRISQPDDIAGLYQCVEGSFTRPLSEAGTVTGRIVQADPALACEALVNAGSLKGRVALIDRGTCFFTEKIRRIQSAGALAVIVVNNVDGDPIVMGAAGDTADIVIPGAMISMADGERIKARIGKAPVATLSSDTQIVHRERADEISIASARGPTHPAYRLKPDLAAPGESILSALTGSGTRGRIATGTSMASPHAAGAAALLRQLHPDWPEADIRAALMNSAVPMRDAGGHVYPESRVGAGRIDVAAAARLTSTARSAAADGDIPLQFGFFEMEAPRSLTGRIRMTHRGLKPETFRVTTAYTLAIDGFVLSAQPAEFTLKSGASTNITMRLDVDPARLTRPPEPTTILTNSAGQAPAFPEVSGQVVLASTNQTLHVPFYAVPRPVSTMTNLMATVGVSSGASGRAGLVTRGLANHDTPLVSVFQLGFTNPARLNFGFSAASDLLAGGAASDFGTRQDVTASTLYFGLGVVGNWTTLNRTVMQIEIQIDNNKDGIPDYVVRNASQSGLESGAIDDPYDMSDILVTGIRKAAALDSESYRNGGALNPLPPDRFDTATFANGVLVLPAPAAMIGLTREQPAFRYRVKVQIPDRAGGGLDQGPWVDFDPTTAPDTVSQGLFQTPFHPDNGLIVVGVNRAAIKKPPQDGLITLLMLHHHAPAGRRVELARLDLNTDDEDHDGLPDLWEAEELLGFESDGTRDTDLDGSSDRAEFIAGTHPHDPNSVLRLKHVGTRPGVLDWESVAGRIYTVERARSVGGPFSPVSGGLEATPPGNRFTDPEVADGPAFYRLRVRLP